MHNLLLLSNSTMPGTEFFSWPKPHVRTFLKSAAGAGVFIPWAAVSLPFDEYASLVVKAFNDMDLSITSLHTLEISKMAEAVEQASFMVVGGGNTFALLKRMYDHQLLDLVRRRVIGGTPFIGWSAGANLAGPTIMTTNDMPIVMPPSFDALNLVPFQINPHYHELKFEGQGGETRRERLQEFLVLNPEKRVIGLPEGMLLQRRGHQLSLVGKGKAALYKAAAEVTYFEEGSDLSFLLV